MNSFLDNASMYSGKTVGLRSECKCGSCSFNTEPHFMMRPFILMFIGIAILFWFVYSFFMKGSKKRFNMKGG
jgi:hypothetical protein